MRGYVFGQTGRARDAAGWMSAETRTRRPHSTRGSARLSSSRRSSRRRWRRSARLTAARDGGGGAARAEQQLETAVAQRAAEQRATSLEQLGMLCNLMDEWESERQAPPCASARTKQPWRRRHKRSPAEQRSSRRCPARSRRPSRSFAAVCKRQACRCLRLRSRRVKRRSSPTSAFTSRRR